MRLWIDTDVGTNPDDAVALLCAARHPDVELVGVSTVDGDTESRAVFARSLVEAPVFAGEKLRAGDVHAARPEAMLAIGPLTNVARLLDAGYEVPRLAVMGGARSAVRHRGEVREVEHNFGAAPSAARAVLRGAAELLLCPLDVTARMKLSDRDRERVAGVAPVLRPMFDEWMAGQRAAGVPGPEALVCLHDPLALLALMDERGIRVESRALAVAADGRLLEDGTAPVHEVVTDVDVDASISRILALLARVPR